MPKNAKLKRVFEYVYLAALAGVMALNYQIFILHNAFAPAGVNGLATMAQYLFHFSIGYMTLLINIPLAIFTYFTVDRSFAKKTLLFALVFSATMLYLQNGPDLSRFIYHTNDGRSTILAPVASGTLNGFIYAISIRLGGSTGGTDFIASYVHKKRPEYSMMRIIFTLNAVVATLSYFVYDYNIEPVILCIIYNFITSSVSDRILKGGEEALKIEMITKHPKQVTDALIRELHHSVTILPAEGGYTHEKKSLLICVVNKHQITRFSQIISEFPDTFACVSNVNNTLGNFKHIGR